MYASTTKLLHIVVINLDLYLKKLIKSLHNIFYKGLDRTDNNWFWILDVEALVLILLSKLLETPILILSSLQKI